MAFVVKLPALAQAILMALNRLQQLPRRTIRFMQRQTHNFRLMLWRRALHGVGTGLSLQYNAIYATLLGADPTQLGTLRSVGNAVGALAAVLPDDVYERGHQIVRDMDRLIYLGVKFGQEATLRDKPMAGFQECSNKLHTIGKQIADLERDLRKAFRRTFE